MKSPRPTTILAVTLLALSLVIVSSETAHAASIVKSEKWIGKLPEPKGLNVGAAKLKRTPLNHWVRFEAPAVARRGTLTLSSGTLQFIKGAMQNPASLRAGEFRLEPLTLADVEIAGRPMSSIEVANVENGSFATVTLANSREELHAAAAFNQLPFE
jgi:hypothetical protein